MMLTLGEISDRLEIQDLLTAYSHAVDTGQWGLLDAVFTDGAVIDYTATGGPKGTLPEIKEFLGSVMPGFPAYQHLLGNCAVTLDGDRATARTMCLNPLVLPGGSDAGEGGVLFCGIWYADELARVDGRWLIAVRRQEKSFMYRAPGAAG
ncbi:nuclear transport factor 2 family protein [Streptomyces sp. NPDC051976]|uniref:nuclear transport factor 2 family protein n=1 Tax=Streptomyces sp. NPDC051976 TaxID=3154947 RepID=UPI0034192DE3